MNEQIGKLLSRSGGEFYEGFLGTPNTIRFTEEEFKTFTELVVCACANFIDNWELYQIEMSEQVHGFIPPTGGAKHLNSISELKNEQAD